MQKSARRQAQKKDTMLDTEEVCRPVQRWRWLDRKARSLQMQRLQILATDRKVLKTIKNDAAVESDCDGSSESR